MIQLGEKYEATVIKPVSSGLLVSIDKAHMTEIVRWNEVSHESMEKSPKLRYKNGDRVIVKAFDTVVERDGSGNKKNIRYLFSIRLAQFDPWDDIKKSLNWSAGSRNVYSMIVNRVTANAASGEVQSGVRAIININELKEYFSKINPRTQMDLLPKRGDRVAGYITRIIDEERYVILDVIRYMEDIRSAASPVIPRLAKPVRQPILTRWRSLAIRSVLIIDSDADSAKSLQKDLDQEGYDAWSASGEKVAEHTLMLLEKNSIDACLLDLDMPTIRQAAELARRISDDFPSVRIIIAYSDEKLIDEFSGELFSDVRCVDIIKKPFKTDELLDVLMEAGDRDPVPISRFFSEAPSQQKSEDIETGSTLETELQREISDLQKKTGAQAAALFEIHPLTMEVKMPASVGIDKKAFSLCKSRLPMSPVRDCAIDKEVILTCDANSPREIGKHRNLKRLIDYIRCVGIPVNVPGEMERCVFVFADAPFNDNSVRFMVEASAARLEKTYIEHNFRKQAYRQKMEATAGITYAILGHELKNKLSILSSTMHALESATGSPENLISENNIERIKIAGKLVDRLFEITSIFKRLAEKYKTERVDINSALEKACKDVESYVNSEKMKMHLSMDNSSSLPHVNANEWALVQVFFNVILNAVQHSILFQKDIVPVINISTRIETDGRHISVEIADMGPGIHAVDFEKIFEPLETTRPDGAGLGLHLCRSVLNEIGGKIYVKESTLYCGSMFKIILPLK